jgi:hypothetical protein
VAIFLLPVFFISAIMWLQIRTDSFMTSTDIPEAHLQDIRRQLAAATQELNNLTMQSRESLRDFEYRVKRHSDKLLSLKVAEQVQQQLIEQGAREAEDELKKKIP